MVRLLPLFVCIVYLIDIKIIHLTYEVSEVHTTSHVLSIHSHLVDIQIQIHIVIQMASQLKFDDIWGKNGENPTRLRMEL